MAIINNIGIVVVVAIGCVAQSLGVSSHVNNAKSSAVYSKGPGLATMIYSTYFGPMHGTTNAPPYSSSRSSISSSIALSSFNTPSSSVPQSSSHAPPMSYSLSSTVSPSSAISSPPLDSSSTHVAPSSHSSTLLSSYTLPASPSLNVTNVSSTATPSSEFAPSASPSQETSSHIKPSKSSKLHPSQSPSPPKVIVECGEECKSLKKRLWAAGVFAVLLGVTSLVFMFLLFRQCRISRDYNDPALSRLI